MRWGVLWRMCYDEEWYDEDAWSCWCILYINMYIPLRRVVLSLPTNEDETPEEFGQTVMIGHAAPGTPQRPLAEVGLTCPSQSTPWRRHWPARPNIARKPGQRKCARAEPGSNNFTISTTGPFRATNFSRTSHHIFLLWAIIIQRICLSPSFG